MLSHQSSNLLPGRHQRQKSTPTIFNTPKTLLPATQRQHGPHRRGLSIDQPLRSPQLQDGLSQQDEILTEDEYINRQRLIQALMREVQQQQQQSTARPGHEKIEILTQSVHRQQSPNNTQQAPCQEHGTGFFTDDQPNNPLTAWENSSFQQHSLEDKFNSNTMDVFQPFDPTTSAGYLDGFGTGHNGYKGNSLPNETTSIKEMPHGIPSPDNLQRPTTADGTKRPCTPLSQTRASQ